MKPLQLQLQRLLKASPFTLAFVLFPLVGLALDVKDVPNPQAINGTWVTDMAEILDEPTEAQLNSVISQLESKNGTEMAVVNVPETAPSASPKEFTTALFNYWGIGKEGKDNGVLLLISKGDRRVEVETGYGVEAILPDAKVGNIINTKITPRFKQGDFKGGTLAGTQALVVALEAPQGSVALLEEPAQDTNFPWWLLGGGGLVAAVIGTAAYATRRRQVFVEPEGRTRLSGNKYRVLCNSCKKPMEKVDASQLKSHLSKPEEVAQQLGNVKFEGWKCPNCSQPRTGLGFHIVACVLNSDQFNKCPTCQELTVKRTKKTLRHATQFSSGKRLITDKCQCCGYRRDREETIPRLPPPPPPSSSSSSGGFTGGDSGGGSYSGGDSGGGSFGGGDSGGGGGGGSW
ncbi:MAG TPA: TPM domain-containing protein [Leptolyngbyaceae cyanobacterium]